MYHSQHIYQNIIYLDVGRVPIHPCPHRCTPLPIHSGRALSETDRRLTLLEQYLDGIRVLLLDYPGTVGGQN